ncbi:MAG: hypothetical protein WCB67_18905 [Solirubrobacteraceae bacterium]
MLATPAVAFVSFVLAIHILAVVIGFGATFTYPLIFATARRADPSVMPWLWSLIQRIDRYVVNPGLGMVLVAGIYLAAHEHKFGAFFVQWGFGAVVVIGAVVGSYMIPREGKLAKLAERDLAAARAGGGGSGSAGDVAWSEEYQKLVRQVSIGGALLDLLVVITVFMMATQAGA